MLDLKAIRADPEPVRAALARRRDGSDARLDRVLELDARRRELLPEVEGLKAQQNAASQAIAAAKQAGEDAAGAIAAMQEVARRGKALREELDGVQAELDEALASLPNPPDPTAADEDAVLYERGEAGRAGKDHLELAGEWIDMEAGARVAGSRFAYLKGDLVLLELALVRWALELLRGKGFEPVIPPVLVREEALLRHRVPARHRAADLPAGRRRALPDGHERGRARVAARGRDPRRASGCRCATPASRPASGARPAPPGATRAGCSACTSSTRSRCSRSSSPRTRVDEHERLLANEEEILTALGIPYRVVNIAVGDLGNSAAKKYDCEAWLPGQQRYRELTSTSNTTDFQARRLNIRYRRRERRAAPRRDAQRHRGRGRADADRADRERRSATTARSRCPRCCTRGVRRASCG